MRQVVEGVDGVTEVGGLGFTLLGATVPGESDLADVAVAGYELAPSGVPAPPPAGHAWADDRLRDSGVAIGDTLLVGDAVAHYRRYGEGKLAVAFCVSIEHSVKVAEAFRAARKAGFDDATIEMILAGKRPTLADAHEQAFLDLAATIVSGGKPTDEEFAGYAQVLKREGVAETLALLGYYGAVALAMKIHDVPLLSHE